MAKHIPPPGFIGLHLTLDGYGCPHKKLADLDLIDLFLQQCPDKIHMATRMSPCVFKFKYHSKVSGDDWGISGFVFTDHGSHISIHTFPERGYLSLDIFPCPEPDHEQAVAFATELFEITRPEKNLLNRGPENEPEPETPLRVA